MTVVDMAGLTGDTADAFDTLVARARSDLGFDLVPRSARRTCAQQAEQYAIGRLPGDTRAIVTRAKGCRSWHVLGRAVDVFVVRGGVRSTDYADYQAMGQLAESLGWVWGGHFSGFGPQGDYGHVEYHPGLTIAALCPNPDNCVDIVPGARKKPAIGVLGVVGGVLLLGAAAVGGVYLAGRT